MTDDNRTTTTPELLKLYLSPPYPPIDPLVRQYLCGPELEPRDEFRWKTVEMADIKHTHTWIHFFIIIRRCNLATLLLGNTQKAPPDRKAMAVCRKVNGITGRQAGRQAAVGSLTLHSVFLLYSNQTAAT